MPDEMDQKQKLFAKFSKTPLITFFKCNVIRSKRKY